MKRRNLLQHLPGLFFLPWISACTQAANNGQTMSDPINPITKTPAQWRALLSPEAYSVLFEEGTEAPNSSTLNNEKREGKFICAACFLPLFESSSKFESSTGWPSFTHAIEGHIATKKDFKLIWPRTEYHCIRCSGHQGHVFNDGPKPRGQRWCNNGVALRFIPADEPLPALRV